MPKYASYFCEMEAPRLPSLFRSKGPKSFEYRPRYYDAFAEKHRQLAEQYSESNKVRRIKPGDLRGKWERNRTSGISKSSISRIILILMVLMALAWWLIWT